MNLEKMMETYKRENSVTPREEKDFRNDTEIQGDCDGSTV